MRAITLPALAAGMLFGLAGVAAAQQQRGQPQTMQGMDHSNMPGMQGSTQPRSNQGARAPARSTQARPNAPAQPRSH